jgi:uncharacterized protein
MDKSKIIESLREIVKLKFENEGSGHDYWHIVRVVNNAKTIAHKEGGDVFIIEIAAWCHDIGDYKLGDDESAEQQIDRILAGLGMANDLIKTINEIVDSVSYKGAHVITNPLTLEGKIVQDADRLDAIGAVGIARCFSYSGHKGTLMHHPDRKPELHDDFESYKNSDGTAIMHFYEKLLLLKDRMQTETGKVLAKQRHSYMESFLEQFYAEWEG